MAASLPYAVPEQLRDLPDLALDLFWTWSHSGDKLWSYMDPELWEHTQNPWIILQTISHDRLQELARTQTFLADLNRLVDERQQYLAQPTLYSRLPNHDKLRGVAFFSMEFGLSEALPLYAGGLGVLAGDFLKTASDLGAPIYGVGLLYQEGYFRQILDASGRQEEAYPYNEPASMPVRPARDGTGKWLRIPIELPGRKVLLRVWEAIVGRTRLFLLDSNDPTNTASDRGITAKLYGGGPILRFLQEVALGVGGWRALDALGIQPDICHINEGHAALAALERLRMAMQRLNLHFQEARWACRAGNILTTHTPVEAGFDLFDPLLIERHLLGRDGLFRELGLDAHHFLALGRKNANDDSEPFNMTYLAMRLAGQTNAVSRLHGEVSRRLFAPLFPRWPQEEVPISHVTNGVHMPSWDSEWADRLWTEKCGKERWRTVHDCGCEKIQTASDEDLWALRGHQRQALVRFVREELFHHLRLRDPHSGKMPHVERYLDPNALTLGFGRRVAAYKRPELLLADAERLARLLSNPNRPVQLVIAGKAHPNDEAGKRIIERWLDFVARPDVRDRVVFLEDYDLNIAEHLVQGVDVWINTPKRPYEACGTSGMKILVNGGLHLSALDGWWEEAYSPEVGWRFGGTMPDDEADAAALYAVLENEVIPEFHRRDETGLPREWIARMRASMAVLGAQYCSNRMLLEYMTALYLPAAQKLNARLADKAARARAMAAWENKLNSHWSQVHVSRSETRPAEKGWRFTAHVQLGELRPEDVRVELVADAIEDQPFLKIPMQKGISIPGALHGYEYAQMVETERPAAHFTCRVVPAHDEVQIPAELPLIYWEN